MNYSDVETKVREATNDEAWGPHGSTMAQLAKYTYTYEHYPEVMAMLWKRMFEAKKNWRRTYKVFINYTNARPHAYTHTFHTNAHPHAHLHTRPHKRTSTHTPTRPYT